MDSEGSEGSEGNHMMNKKQLDTCIHSVLDYYKEEE
jgi:hypothetical protein